MPLQYVADKSQCNTINCDLGDNSLSIKTTSPYFEAGYSEITEVNKSEVFRVEANFPVSYPEGTFEFSIKFDSGGYKNEIISKGYLSGINEISSIEQYFYVPPFGQVSGEATIDVFIPGWGIANYKILIK
jgi:hypothetical protein